MTKAYAISIIRELSMDERSWANDYMSWRGKKQMAAQRCYEQWALEELILHIRKSHKPPIDAAEEFCKKMDSYACSGDIMFSIAYDAGLYALDMLLTAEE